LAESIEFIVGLGNPGREYELTRHNAGADFVSELARCYGATLKVDSKFFGLTCQITIANQDIRLLIPTTFMNRSGQSVAAVCNFYKIDPSLTLVVHDELDFEPGIVKLKKAGGHGGHNGLRDIISCLGNNANFYRMRIGIGHPGNPKAVSGYVLKRAPLSQKTLTNSAIDKAISVLPLIIKNKWEHATNDLHSFTAQ
tara:strand:+ start:502 stop:1092 length:591 start_codon:yes stop_codon:yes gene_type:complete